MQFDCIVLCLNCTYMFVTIWNVCKAPMKTSVNCLALPWVNKCNKYMLTVTFKFQNLVGLLVLMVIRFLG